MLRNSYIFYVYALAHRPAEVRECKIKENKIVVLIVHIRENLSN